MPILFNLSQVLTVASQVVSIFMTRLQSQKRLLTCMSLVTITTISLLVYIICFQGKEVLSLISRLFQQICEKCMRCRDFPT